MAEVGRMTDRYALLGNPVSHSLSPRIHTLFAAQTDQQISYEAICAPLDQFAETVRGLAELGFRGANVTLPFKLEAMAVADRVSPRASAANAANTLSFQTDSSIVADNTDGAGLLIDLVRLDLPIKDIRLMIIGAGGASRGIVGPLLDAGVRTLHIANRTPEKARQLIREFSGDARIRLCLPEEFGNCEFDAMINASSASVTGKLPEFFPPEFKRPILWGYDLFYAPADTVFVQWLKEQGIESAHDGLGMLVGQAAESFAVWRGVLPAVAPVINELRKG